MVVKWKDCIPWLEKRHPISTIDLTAWRTVKRNFGQSVILSPASLEGTLEAAIPRIRYLAACQFSMRVIRTKDLLKQEWKRILTHPNEWYKIAATYSLSELTAMFAVYKAKPKSKLQSKALSRVQEALQTRFGIARIPSITMRVPNGALKYSAPIHKALAQVLTGTPLDPQVVSFILSNFRIARTKRKAIADILVNSRRHAKSFEPDKPPMCLNNCTSPEHDVAMAENFEGHVRHILGQYAKDIPTPNFFDSRLEILSAFRDILPSIEKLISDPNHKNLTKKFDEHDPIFSQVFQLLENSVKSSPNNAKKVPSA